MKCILCHVRPAELPDRERMGRPVKRVCRVCHGERLQADLKHIVRVYKGTEVQNFATETDADHYTEGSVPEPNHTPDKDERFK